jgi:hypothetical protein
MKQYTTSTINKALAYTNNHNCQSKVSKISENGKFIFSLFMGIHRQEF